MSQTTRETVTQERARLTTIDGLLAAADAIPVGERTAIYKAAADQANTLWVRLRGLATRTEHR